MLRVDLLRTDDFQIRLLIEKEGNKKNQRTTSVFSANFLLTGRVSLLTSVPSGNIRSANGVPNERARIAVRANFRVNSFRSEAQERERKMK